VRPQRIVLEHHPQVAAFDRDPGDVLLAETDGAGVRRDEAGDQPQQRGLAATAAAEQNSSPAAMSRSIPSSTRVMPS
jgi:hypothetical protein